MSATTEVGSAVLLQSSFPLTYARQNARPHGPKTRHRMATISRLRAMRKTDKGQTTASTYWLRQFTDIQTFLTLKTTKWGSTSGLSSTAMELTQDSPFVLQIFAVDFYGDFQEPVIIGRGPSAHVDLGAEERRISKKHVVVDYVPELQIFQLQCLGVNSCRVNGHIETRRCPPTILENGDIIEIDGKLLRFQFPLVSPPEPRFVPKRASAETYEDISVKRRRLATQLWASSF